MALFSDASSRMSAAVARTPGAAAPWIQWLARFGYAARGAVYLIIGFIAVRAAISSAQRGPEDSSGALLLILRQPLGRVLLGLLAFGLVGWVVWRLVQAFRDPEKIGSDAKGIAKRTGYVISALLYGALMVEAARLAMGTGSGGGGGESSADHWTAVVMRQPAGRWIIAAAGALIVLFGLYELFRAYRAKFRRKLDLSGLSHDAERRVILLGRAGYVARGIVFGIIGWFLVQAALQYDPQEARGFESALQTLEQQGYGQWLLALVGAGLLCYGLFQLAEARYRVIRPL